MKTQPGKRITVEIVAAPRRAAALKTLVRLCRMDPGARRRQAHQQRKRPSWEEWRRGNATWHHQMQTRPPVRIEKGARYSLPATVDVLRDLKSVEAFVKSV